MDSYINNISSIGDCYFINPVDKARKYFDFNQMDYNSYPQLCKPPDNREWSFSPLPSPESPCFDISVSSTYEDNTLNLPEQTFDCLMSPNSMDDQPSCSEPLVSKECQDAFGHVAQFHEKDQWSDLTGEGDLVPGSPQSDNLSPMGFQVQKSQFPFPMDLQPSSNDVSSIPSSSSQSHMPSKRPKPSKEIGERRRQNTLHQMLLSTSTSKTTKPKPSNSSPASRSPKSPPKHPRLNHNQIEKQYRNRLNNRFEALLKVLPRENEVGSEERKVGKAEVLVLAIEHIHELESDWRRLEEENERLDGLMRGIEERWVEAGGVVLP